MKLLVSILGLTFTLWADYPENWIVNPEDFEHVHTVTAQLVVHQSFTTDTTQIIAAFYNGEYRGGAVAQEVNGSWLYFLMIYGDGSEGLMSLAYYDTELDSIFNINENIYFIPNGTTGLPDSPHIFHGGGVNIAPVANAGSDYLVGENELITLDGSESYDLDNDSLYFQWESLSSINLTNATSATPSLTTPNSNETVHYLFTLVVSDGILSSSPDTAWVTVLNTLNNSEELKPNLFSLYPAYPNPFNPITTIRFSVEKSNLLSLRIYDITGRLVDELVNGELPAGEHEVVWNASTQPSGVYFVQLVSGNNVQMGKVILIK